MPARAGRPGKAGAPSLARLRGWCPSRPASKTRGLDLQYGGEHGRRREPRLAGPRKPTRRTLRSSRTAHWWWCGVGRRRLRPGRAQGRRTGLCPCSLRSVRQASPDPQGASASSLAQHRSAHARVQKRLDIAASARSWSGYGGPPDRGAGQPGTPSPMPNAVNGRGGRCRPCHGPVDAGCVAAPSRRPPSGSPALSSSV